MTIEWRFSHPLTGLACTARFDGALLTVEAHAGVYWDVEAHVDLYWEAGRTARLLDQSGVARTHCASVEAARRELMAIGVERSELQ